MSFMQKFFNERNKKSQIADLGHDNKDMLEYRAKILDKYNSYLKEEIDAFHMFDAQRDYLEFSLREAGYDYYNAERRLKDVNKALIDTQLMYLSVTYKMLCKNQSAYEMIINFIDNNDFSSYKSKNKRNASILSNKKLCHILTLYILLAREGHEIDVFKEQTAAQSRQRRFTVPELIKPVVYFPDADSIIAYTLKLRSHISKSTIENIEDKNTVYGALILSVIADRCSSDEFVLYDEHILDNLDDIIEYI